MYGEGNSARLTGEHETSSMSTFSFGAGNRAASVRIPTDTVKNNGKGYIEDRRPASNIDPYVVGAMLVDTTLLEGKYSGDLQKHFKAWINQKHDPKSVVPEE